MNKIYYTLLTLPVVLTSCYPSALLDEAPRVAPDLVEGIPGLIANPASPTSWWKVLSAAAILVAAGTLGPSAARKVRAFLGKSRV